MKFSSLNLKFSRNIFEERWGRDKNQKYHSLRVDCQAYNTGTEKWEREYIVEKKIKREGRQKKLRWKNENSSDW